MGSHAQRFSRRLPAAVGLAALLMCISVCLGKLTALTVLVCRSEASLQVGQTCVSADDSIVQRSEPARLYCSRSIRVAQDACRHY